MAWSVGPSTGVDGAINGAITPAIDTTGMDFAIANVACLLGTVPVLSDFYGHVWNLLTARNSSDGSNQMYWTRGGVFGPGHTFQVAGANTFSNVTVMTFSGSKTPPLTDVENGAVQAAANGNFVGLTASFPNCLYAVGIEANLNTDFDTACSITDGFTIPANCRRKSVAGQGFANGLAYFIQIGGPAAKAPLWGWTSNCPSATEIADFQMAPSGGGGFYNAEE